MAAADKVKFFNGAFWFFTLAVVLLPVGLGGNRPLSFALAQGVMALSCLLLFLGRGAWQEPLLFPRLRVALCLFAAVIVWAFVQTQSFVPENWMHPLWKEAAIVLGKPLHGAIAISPEESLYGLNRLITYIAVGLLAYLFGQDSKRARQLIEALWATGVAICAYGLIVYITGSQKILWMDKWAYQDDLTATFVNRNHFAVFAGIVLTSGAALLAQSWREQVGIKKSHERPAATRAWLSHEGIPQIFFLVLVEFCIVLSHSRAGLVLSLASLGSYFFFFQIYRRAWGRALMVALFGAIILMLVLMAAGQYSDRFANLFSDYSSTDRLKVYGLTIEAVRDNPWLGYGLDSFQAVFRLYQRGMIMEFSHAHSDVLESMLDLGMPAAFLLWLALLLLAGGLARGVARRHRGGMYPCLALASCVIVIGHSFVDFSMQIPGVVVPWAALVGLGLAQSWRKSEKQPAHEWVE